MPIYEYQCQKCGAFEVTQRITEKPLAKCPTCKAKVKKLISNTSFQLKGTGWYVTDYARKGNGAKSDSAKDENGAKPSSSDSKDSSDSQDSKSEAKKENSSSSSDKSSSSTSSSTSA